MVEAANADPSDGDEIERGPLAIDRLIETGRPEVLRRGAVNEPLDSGPTRAGVESCDNANCGRHKSGLAARGGSRTVKQEVINLFYGNGTA